MLVELEWDAGEVFVVKGKIDGLGNTCIHLFRVLQESLLLDQLVEQLSFSLEEDLASASDQIGQLIDVLFELLVLDAEVVLHIGNCTMSDRGRVHSMIGEHLCELIEIVPDSLLHFRL